MSTFKVMDGALCSSIHDTKDEADEAMEELRASLEAAVEQAESDLADFDSDYKVVEES